MREFKDVRVRVRNDYVHAIFVMAVRSIMAQDRKNRWIGVAIFLYFVVQYPLLWLFSKLYKNHQATTGFFTTARK